MFHCNTQNSVFHRKPNVSSIATAYFAILILPTYFFHVWLFLIRTKRSGDIEQNPEPKPNSCQSFSICHWNRNSISAHSFIKLSLLRPYIAIHKFDDACLSETCLNASISNDDNSLEDPAYNLFGADHPSKLNAEVFVFVIEILFP